MEQLAAGGVIQPHLNCNIKRGVVALVAHREREEGQLLTLERRVNLVAVGVGNRDVIAVDRKVNQVGRPDRAVHDEVKQPVAVDVGRRRRVEDAVGILAMLERHMPQLGLPSAAAAAVTAVEREALGGGAAEDVPVVATEAVLGVDYRQDGRRNRVLVVVPATAPGRGVVGGVPQLRAVRLERPDVRLLGIGGRAGVKPGDCHQLQVAIAVNVADGGRRVHIAAVTESVTGVPASRDGAVQLVDVQASVAAILGRRPRHDNLGAAVSGEIGQQQARQQRVQVAVGRGDDAADRLGPPARNRVAALNAVDFQVAVVVERNECFAAGALAQHHRRGYFGGVELKVRDEGAITIKCDNRCSAFGGVEAAYNQVVATVKVADGGVRANNREAGIV